MERNIWINWWIIFSIRYSRLFWAYYHKSDRAADNLPKRIYLNKVTAEATGDLSCNKIPNKFTKVPRSSPGYFKDSYKGKKILDSIEKYQKKDILSKNKTKKLLKI